MINEVIPELERATKKFPTWPTDPLHAIAVIGEEFGELTQAALQLAYEPQKSSRDKVREEAVQLAAMALRFIISLDRYEYKPVPQHSQVKLWTWQEITERLLAERHDLWQRLADAGEVGDES